MHYTVISGPGADDELAMIWLHASDRDVVRQAANEIENILRSAPLSHGADQGDYRILTVEPLTVLYTVLPDDCQVIIRHFTCGN